MLCKRLCSIVDGSKTGTHIHTANVALTAYSYLVLLCVIFGWIVLRCKWKNTFCQYKCFFYNKSHSESSTAVFIEQKKQSLLHLLCITLLGTSVLLCCGICIVKAGSFRFLLYIRTQCCCSAQLVIDWWHENTVSTKSWGPCPYLTTGL